MLAYDDPNDPNKQNQPQQPPANVIPYNNTAQPDPNANPNASDPNAKPDKPKETEEQKSKKEAIKGAGQAVATAGQGLMSAAMAQMQSDAFSSIYNYPQINVQKQATPTTNLQQTGIGYQPVEYREPQMISYSDRNLKKKIKPAEDKLRNFLNHIYSRTK